jgi:hypothetical protein
MFHRFLTLICLACITVAVQSQEFYLKPQARYHVPLTYQEAPELYNAAIVVATSTGYYYTYIITQAKKFSLAKGLSYGGSLGYRFNNFIGAEISLHYFQIKEEFVSDDIPPHYPIGPTAWQYRTINASPSLVIIEQIGRVRIAARSGIIIGRSSLGKSIIFEDKRKTYKFNPGLAWGYTFGLEFSYSLTHNVGLSLEAGIDNVFYKPRKAILKQDDFSYWDLDELPQYLKEIYYVRKVDHERVYYDLLNDTYYTDSNKPLLRLRETLKVNSFYTGIGLCYRFGNHETN